jgi:drug/metabolite transporter (DMT)-like permease
MIFLALAVCCSVSIGMIFKVAGRDDLDRTALLTVNYAAAVGVAATLILLGGRGEAAGLTLTPSLIVLGIGTGALLIFGFFMLSLSTDVAGMGLSIGVMRVSVVIPFLASWLIWSEEPSVAQLAGMGFAATSFFLLAQTKGENAQAASDSRGENALSREVLATPAEVSPHGGGGEPAATQAQRGGDVALEMRSERAEAQAGDAAREGDTAEESTGADGSTDADGSADEAEVGFDVPEPSAKVVLTLFVLFLAGGAVDIIMKTFQESYGATNSRFLFLLLSFGIAFLIGLAIVLQKGIRTGEWPDRATGAWGTLLGVINYGSLEFLLRALEVLPGTVVFPINNIAIVVLAAILGVMFWGERLSKINLAGLALALVGLVFLNL